MTDQQTTTAAAGPDVGGKTTFPHRDDFNGRRRDFLITRPDIALIADVAAVTVQGWVTDRQLDFPPPARRGGPSQRNYYRLGDVLDWLCRTGRIECDEMADMLTQQDVATRLGVAVGTVKQWRRRDIFPDPDLTIDRTPYWKPATVDSWTGRPQRGGNTRAPRTFTPPRPPSAARRREIEKAR